MEIISRYFEDCKELLLEPSRFFREAWDRYTLNEAIVFGLVSTWLSAVIVFFWETLSKVFLYKNLLEWIQDVTNISDDLMSSFDFAQEGFFTAVAFLLLNPFFSLLSICFTAFLLLLFGRLFISNAHIKYSDLLKIAAIASVGSWLALIPLVGGLVAYIAVLIFLILGLREHYSLTAKRAALVVLAPQALLLSVLLAILFFGLIIFTIIPWDNLLG